MGELCKEEHTATRELASGDVHDDRKGGEEDGARRARRGRSREQRERRVLEGRAALADRAHADLKVLEPQRRVAPDRRAVSDVDVALRQRRVDDGDAGRRRGNLWLGGGVVDEAGEEKVAARLRDDGGARLLTPALDEHDGDAASTDLVEEAARRRDGRHHGAADAGDERLDRGEVEWAAALLGRDVDALARLLRRQLLLRNRRDGDTAVTLKCLLLSSESGFESGFLGDIEGVHRSRN